MLCDISTLVLERSSNAPLIVGIQSQVLLLGIAFNSPSPAASNGAVRLSVYKYLTHHRYRQGGD